MSLKERNEYHYRREERKIKRILNAVHALLVGWLAFFMSPFFLTSSMQKVWHPQVKYRQNRFLISHCIASLERKTSKTLFFQINDNKWETSKRNTKAKRNTWIQSLRITKEMISPINSQPFYPHKTQLNKKNHKIYSFPLSTSSSSPSSSSSFSSIQGIERKWRNEKKKRDAETKKSPEKNKKKMKKTCTSKWENCVLEEGIENLDMDGGWVLILNQLLLLANLIKDKISGTS